ncbi:cytochrome b5 reductase 4 isoform X3 [Peromyscus californicus insignis]|uniref:cytochrome b5 reductase 4 isoform X3 n=1 Tax=Peromyscus californicus insignis TaxID=564181 RepID=UPI0022A73DA4|nr:cytochrome b5 reductase 4 isoform X3 [Peromyscus californicus insignis]
MLNVPSQAFPAPGSQQRVASQGRSKVPLKQGRSLMDWIRLTRSGKDLTGLKGRLIDVTEEELKTHNKKDDCWICIRGLVYNVSPYMEYHPGGEDELMRAAGADGTDLFNEVHRWVNYESMLKECLVGRMAMKPAVPKDCHEGKRVLNVEPRPLKLMPVSASTLRGRRSFGPPYLLCSNSDLLPCSQKDGCMLPKSQVTDTLPKEGPSSPSYDWFQTESSVTIVIYTKQKNINLDSVVVDLQDDILRAELAVIKDHSYLIHIELSHEVQENFSVRAIENVGKVDIVLQKRENISWKCLGHPLEKHDSFIPKKDTGLYYRKCQLISKEDVTHDTRLFCLMLPPSTHLQVPVGQHVYLKLSVTGDFVSVSSPEGNFKVSKLQDVEDLFLLAAGTGFTPMVNVLNYALTSMSSLRKVKLMFFNKTEDDIIWRCQLEKLALKDKRVDVEFVLSAPSSEWSGKQGHVSPALLSEFLQRSSENSRVFLCICGPTPFTDEGIRLLHDLNFSTDEIHGFTA